jgi:antimicrobial peptide system SdpA family protein
MTTTVIVGVVYACLLAVAGTLSLAATLPSNIIWERTQLQALRIELNTIAGQSFAFFTRSPQTEQIVAYRLLPDGTAGASLMVTPQGTPANLFGVSRTQRAQGPELANLVQAVEPKMWLDCTGLDRGTCLAQIARASKTVLHNTSPVPTVCGQVLLAGERTNKWAYRHLTDSGYAIHQVVSASVDCPDGR